MKALILNYINTFVTHDVNTKVIAKKFGLTTQQAYNFLQQLYTEKEIEKLEPENGNNLNACDWIKIDK